MPACVVLRGSVLTAWRAGRVYSQLTCSLPAEFCRPLVCVCILLRVCPVRFSAMTAADDAAVLAKVESELKYQMDEAGVPLPGFDCVRVFAGIDETKAEVRQALKVELPLDYSADAESRRNMALLLAVWDACRLHLAVQEKNKTDAKLGVQARNVPSTEHAAMRMAVEKLYGKLKDKELPSKTFLAQELEQVEENAPQAEDLRDVTSLEDAEMEAYNALIDPSTFTLRIKPGRTTTTPPGTENAASSAWIRVGDGEEPGLGLGCLTAVWMPFGSCRTTCLAHMLLGSVPPAVMRHLGAWFLCMRVNCARRPIIMFGMALRLTCAR